MSTDRSHQAALISLAELIRFGVKTLIGIALARLLTPAELGSYRQLFLIYTTISTLMMMGIPQSLIYFLPRLESDEKRRLHVGKIMNLSMALSVAFALILLLLRGVIAEKFNNPALAGLLIIYAAYPVFMFSSSLYSYVMLGQSNAPAAAKFTIFSVCTDAVLIFGAAFITRDLKWIVSAVILSAFFQWLYSRIRLFRYRAALKPDFSFYRQQFAYALPLGLSSLIGMLSIQLDKFVISAYFDPASFAIFSIGAMELPFVSIFTNSVTSVLVPAMSKDGSTQGISQMFRGSVRKNALWIFPTALLCYHWAPQIISFLYTDRYLAAVEYFRIYLYILPLRVATFGMIFLALGKTRLIMYNAIFTLACNLVLNLILVQYMGMRGAAIATVIVTALSTLAYILWLNIKMGFSFGQMIPWWAVIKTAAATFLAFYVSSLVEFARADAAIKFTRAPLFAMLYFAVALLIGALLPYDLQTLNAFAKNLWQRLIPGSRS